MKNPNKFSLLNPIIRRFWPAQILVSIMAQILLVTTTPVMAHHVMGGKMPSNFFEGFMSGLGHPVIGFDHLTFIVSVGLFAAIKSQGIFIPISFILSAMVGTGIHLAKLNIPGVELFVAGSILLFGILLVLKEQPNTVIITVLTAIAGLFHGYAYGESIFGAEMTPLLAYLLGFSFIQLMIILAVFWLTKNLVSSQFKPGNNILQSSGFVICGIGVTFVFSQIVNLLLPLPKG